MRGLEAHTGKVGLLQPLSPGPRGDATQPRAVPGHLSAETLPLLQLLRASCPPGSSEGECGMPAWGGLSLPPLPRLEGWRSGSCPALPWRGLCPREPPFTGLALWGLPPLPPIPWREAPLSSPGHLPGELVTVPRATPGHRGDCYFTCSSLLATMRGAELDPRGCPCSIRAHRGGDLPEPQARSPRAQPGAPRPRPTGWLPQSHLHAGPQRAHSTQGRE